MHSSSKSVSGILLITRFFSLWPVGTRGALGSPLMISRWFLGSFLTCMHPSALSWRLKRNSCTSPEVFIVFTILPWKLQASGYSWSLSSTSSTQRDYQPLPISHTLCAAVWKLSPSSKLIDLCGLPCLFPIAHKSLSFVPQC